MDIQNMMNFLHRYPYHHESLLSMSDFLRMQGQFPESTKLVRRGIFAYEKCFSPGFVISDKKPRVRLDFSQKLANVFADLIIR